MNTDMTTKFTDQFSWQSNKTIHTDIIKETPQKTYITSTYSRPPKSSRYSPKPTDNKDHDKYQHVLTYFDETIIKHPYLNTDDVALAFNQ